MAKLTNQLEHGVALLEEPGQHIINENVGHLSSSPANYPQTQIQSVHCCCVLNFLQRSMGQKTFDAF